MRSAVLLLVLVGCGGEAPPEPTIDDGPTFVRSTVFGEAMETEQDAGKPVQPPTAPPAPSEPMGMAGMGEDPWAFLDASTDTGTPDAGSPMCVAEDTPWDCQRQECQGGELVTIVDDTDAQPWDEKHPRWAELHQTSNSRCNMVGCLDGEPNRVFSRPDGAYNDGTGVCYRCMNGATLTQPCP
jgi:hypothetical protein